MNSKIKKTTVPLDPGIRQEKTYWYEKKKKSEEELSFRRRDEFVWGAAQTYMLLCQNENSLRISRI